MNEHPESSAAQTIGTFSLAPNPAQLHREFRHLKKSWCWLLSFGILLSVCGMIALLIPIAAAGVAMIVLGTVLMVSGIATIVTAFCSGRSSSLLLQLLCGVLYLVSGYVISDEPLRSAVRMAAFIAAFFIILGIFRILASLVIRFPFWGWSLLNGVVTLMCGVVIYRHFSAEKALWVVGLLVGLEMLFHGWTWIMLALAIKHIPDEAA